MESKDYFEKVMQAYNQHRNGRSLRKYCKNEAIDYDWVMEFKKNYPNVKKREAENPQPVNFILLTVTNDEKCQPAWEVERLLLKSPEGQTLEIKSSSLFVVADLLHKLS